MPPAPTYDPTAPFFAAAEEEEAAPSSSPAAPSSAWDALTAALRTHGILHKSPAASDTATAPSDCTTLGELLLPPSSSSSSSIDDGGNSNNTSNDNDDDNAPLLLVLVSGSWCAPCRNFTPVLASLTPTLTARNVTTVFCSACADADSFRAYYAKMPPEWRALPFDEDGEDDRDDLMEHLGAQSLPTLVVMDPLRGRVVVPNAVMEVQAGGHEGIERLIQKWKGMARKDGEGGEGGDGIVAAAGTSGSAANVKPGRDPNNADDKTETDDDDDDDESLTLRYTLPSSPGLLCQYFQTQLLSPHLPEALSTIVLRRAPADDDAAALALADASLRTTRGPGERWLFRTAAPALPVNSWGGSLGFEAGAIECWEIERDDGVGGTSTSGGGNGGNDGPTGGAGDGPDTISRAVVHIENETGRLLLVFRETIVMERSADDGGGCEVTKTLNLDGVPAMAHGPFRRRWKKESEAIFHALLGTCDRKKVAMTATTTTTK